MEDGPWETLEKIDLNHQPTPNEILREHAFIAGMSFLSQYSTSAQNNTTGNETVEEL